MLVVVKFPGFWVLHANPTGKRIRVKIKVLKQRFEALRWFIREITSFEVPSSFKSSEQGVVYTIYRSNTRVFSVITMRNGSETTLFCELN